MARRGRVALGVAAGVATAATAAALSARRAARRLRAGEDVRVVAGLVAPVDELRSLPSHDGGRISVVSRGSGPPIVLSHGLMLSARTWAEQMRTLPDLGFRTVAFDPRGHGDSTVGEHGHTIETLAWDVRTVLEGLDLHDSVLVGHSMGGVAVQSFCVRFPEVAAQRVAGIVLLSTAARTYLNGSPRLARVLWRIARGAPDVSRLLSARDLGLLVTRIGFGRQPDPNHVELTRQMILACDPETRRDAPGALVGLDLTPDLPRIALPTLVIAGTADVLTPPAEARRIARLVPGARLELVEHGGHMLMLEQAERIDDLVAEFAHSVQGHASQRVSGTVPGAAG